MDKKLKIKLLESKDKEISDMPDEVLEHILTFVRPRQLISVCRLVSKHWKSVSTRVCRRSHVKIQLNRDYPKFEQIFATFTNLDDLPWSSCCFVLGKPLEQKGSNNRNFSTYHTHFYTPHEDKQLSKEVLNQFIQAFGPTIRNIQFERRNYDYEPDTQIIMQFTSNLPQLEEIEFLEDKELEASADRLLRTNGHPLENVAFDGAEFQLRKLKRVTLFIHTAAEVTFLDFLLTKTGAKLNFICLLMKNYSYDVDDQTVQKLVTGIAKVPSIVLKGLNICGFHDCSNILPSVTSKKLCVSDFEAKINDPKWEDYEERFQSLSAFIHSVSPHLRKLTLHNYLCRINEASPLLTIPILPILKTLKLMYFRFQRQLPNTLPSFPNQLHVVEEFRILTYGDMKLSCVAGCFDSVTKLVTPSPLDYCPMQGDNWDRIFPNLIKLKLSDAVNGVELVHIFTNLTRLVHLKMKINMMQDEDLNAVLSGIRDPDAMMQQSEEAICQFRTDHPCPSLLSMTGLKTLNMEICGGELRDSGAHLALLRMQPLDSMIIIVLCSTIKISKSVEKALEEHHNTFFYLPTC